MDSRGKETKGTLEVSNQNEAINRLKEMGFFPTKVTEAAKESGKKTDKKAAKGGAKGAAGGAKGAKGKINLNNIKIPFIGGGVKTKVLCTFTRQLATLVDAGLPLLRGLRVLNKQEHNPALKEAIEKMAVSVEGGSTFSEALAQHPTVSLSAWSRPAKWVVCWRWSSTACPSSWKRPKRSKARLWPPCFIPSRCFALPWRS